MMRRSLAGLALLFIAGATLAKPATEEVQTLHLIQIWQEHVAPDAPLLRDEIWLTREMMRVERRHVEDDPSGPPREIELWREGTVWLYRPAQHEFTVSHGYTPQSLQSRFEVLDFGHVRLLFLDPQFQAQLSERDVEDGGQRLHIVEGSIEVDGETVDIRLVQNLETGLLTRYEAIKSGANGEAQPVWITDVLGINEEFDPEFFTLSLPDEVEVTWEYGPPPALSLDWPDYIRGGRSEPEPEPEALAVIERMARTYRALHSLECVVHSVYRIEREGGVEPSEQTARLALIFQRPDRLWVRHRNFEGRLTITTARDNDFMHYNTEAGTYRIIRAGGTDVPGSTNIGWPAVEHYDHARYFHVPIGWTPLLALKFAFFDPEKVINLRGARLVGEERVNGRRCVVVEVPQRAYLGGISLGKLTHAALTLWVDKHSNLLRRVRSDEQYATGHLVLVEDYTNVATQRRYPEYLFAVAPPPGTQPEPARQPAIPAVAREQLVGRPAPSFTLSNLSGESVSLDDLAGQLVLIDFWATWCGPCRAALPHTQALWDTYRERGLAVLAVNLEEATEVVSAFMEQMEYTLPVVLDRTGEVAGRYGVSGIPHYVLIDRDGVVQYEWMGFPGEAAILDALRDLGIE